VLEHMAESRSGGSGVVNGKDHGRDFNHDLLGALSPWTPSSSSG